MPDEPLEAAEIGSLPPETRNLLFAISMDMWPETQAAAAYGIVSQEHLEAIYLPYRKGEISRGQLADAVGDGAKLTALVNASPSNPHRDIQFDAPSGKLSLAELRQRVGAEPKKDVKQEQQPGKGKDIDYER